MKGHTMNYGISSDPHELDFPQWPIGNGGPPDPWTSMIPLLVFTLLIVIAALLR